MQSFPWGSSSCPPCAGDYAALTLPDDEPTRFLYREFMLSAWNVLRQFDRFLHDVKDPQAVVIFNGQTFPEAAVRWLAVRRGIRVITHEVSM